MIASSTWSQSNACFSSRNDFSFSRPNSQSRGITKGDFDNDGNLDVVTTAYTSGAGQKRFYFQKGLGNGKFGTATGYCTSGNLPQDIKSADFNNDGNLDVAFANQTGVYIYHGQGNGLFDSITSLTLTSGKYLALGDFNEDGAMDVVATSANSQFTLFRGTLGNPTLFTSSVFTTSSSIQNMEVADMDGDNHLDVVSYTGSGIYISRNNNGSLGNFFTGTAVSTTGTTAADLTLCDIDNDGDTDVVASNKGSNNISVMKNNGSGTLTFHALYTTEAGPDGIDNFDINQDGFKDIVVTNMGASTITVFFGSSGGVLNLYQTAQASGNPRALVVGQFTSDTYADIVTAQNSGPYINSFIGNNSHNYLQTNLFDIAASPSSAFPADFNGDGNQDVAITHSGLNSVQIYLGNGAGNFTTGATLSTGTTPVYIIGEDLDNSGSMDLVVVNNGSNNISVFYGTGSGTFSAGTTYSVGTTPVQAKIGHLNGDAFADIVVSNSGSSNISTLIASGATSFNTAIPTTTNATPYAVLITDYDLDGFNDVLVGHNANTQLLRFKGDGTGSLTANGNVGTGTATYAFITALEAADLDGDGDNDVIVGRSGDIGKTAVPGTTTGSATGNTPGIMNATLIPGVSGAISGIKIVDVNNDGKLDVLGVFNNGGTSVGALTVATATNFGINAGYVLTPTNVGFASEIDASGLAAADFNNDGLVDVIVPNKTSNSFTLHLNTTPIITAGGPTTFCSGNSVTLTSTPATYWYNWDPNSETTQAISATANGPYYVVTSSSWSDWCQAKSDTITVTVTPGPTAPTITPGGPTTFCAGGNVLLTSSEATGNQWYKDNVLISGATNQTYSATTAGVYTVTYTSGGCTSSQSTGITVTASQTPVITAGGPTTFCTGGSVVLTSDVTTNLLWSNGATTPSITVTTSGNYSVQNIVGGCPTLTSNTIVVTVAGTLSTPTISPAGPVTLCPSGSVTLTSSSPTNNIWSTGATTQSIVVNTPGSYFVHLDNGSCSSPNSTAVTVTAGSTPAAPTITPGGPTTFCTGGSVTLTSSAGTSYLWSNGATTASINVTTGGTYTVQVTNASGCQSPVSAGTTVTVNTPPAAPTITPGGPTTFCAGGSVTLTSSAGTSYLWSNGATTASINVTTAGSYTVQVTNASGCQSVASAATVVTVNALPAAPTITPGGPTTFCAGGSVTLTSSAGTAYLWSNGATTASINVTTAGSYTVQVTNSGCQSPASAPTVVTVNALPAAPTITPGGPTTFCAGGSVTLTSSAGTSYLWSTGATTASINVTTAGSYTVQVTNASGCQSSASAPTVVTINALPAAPTITAGGPTTFCNGNSVTLTSSAGTSYLWSTGATTASINVTTTGTYTVQVTNASGCQSAASTGTTVTVTTGPPAPTITAGGSTTFCAGGSVTLTSSAGTTYLWSNGATTPSINATTSGSYTVQITNASGCQSVASTATVVTVNALPAVPTITPSGPTTFCSGGSVTLTSSAGTSYLWSNGATTASINVTTSGSYTVQVTNASGCQSTASVPTVVTVNALPAAPTITPGGATTFCDGGSVTLTSSAGTSYLWSNAATTASISATTSGSYTVQITDANGCTSPFSSPIAVTVNALPATPTITPGGPTTFCAGGSVTLTSSAGISYLWSNGATTPSINVTASGSYTVQITNASGCLSTASAPTVVTVNALPATPTISSSGAVNFCLGSSVVLTSSTGTSYLWSTGETTQSITVTASGSYSVQVTNAAGCLSASSAPTNVNVNPLPSTPNISAGGPTTFCAGGSVTLTSTGGFSYLWSNGETTQSIVVNSSGNYSVQIVNGSGCQSSSSNVISVTVNPLPATPAITPGGPTTFCAGGSVTLTSSPGTTYLWSTGATTASINVTTSGSYTVQITGSNGCTSLLSSPTNVTVNPVPSVPTITAAGPTTFCDGGSVILTSSASSGNLWSTGETTQSITVTSSGSYTVEQILAGCSSGNSLAETVTVNPNPSVPTITASGPTSFCAGGSVVLTSSSSTGNLWSTSETTQSITVTTSGTYTLDVTNGFGCTSSSSTIVTVNPIPPVPTITAGGPTTFCSGSSVVLTSSASSGNLWSTGETTQSITVTTAGSYTVEQILAGCSSGVSASTNTTVNPTPVTPTITAASATTFCDGGSVILTSSASTGNVWSTGETTQSITVTVSGSYFVNVVGGPCTSAASNVINVTVNPIPSVPTITAGGPTTFCSGSSVVLTSSASSGNLWSTGETTQSITVSTSGSYSVSIVDGPCTSAASNIINVTVNPIPSAPTITAGGPTTFCTGGSVVLTSSASSGNLWSTGATTQSITVSTSGVYTVNVTQLGCTGPDASQTITVNPIPSAPTITAGGPTTFCTGGSVVLNSSVSSGNTWSTTETTQSIVVTTSGSYTVTQTLLGCTSSASTPVNVIVNAIPAVPTITASGPTTFCAGGSVTLTSSSASNNFWSNGATTQSIVVNTSGTFLVQVISNGCSSGTSAPKTVTVNSLPPAPTIVTGTTESICAGSSVTLTSSSTGGNMWSTGELTQSISVSSAGSYSVTVTDGNGCVSPSSSPTVVTVNPIPAAPIISANGPTSFCSGGNVTLTSSYASNNLWSSGSTANSITLSSNGTYTVTHTDGNGCVSPASAPVTITVNSIPAAPVITASGPTSFCSGGSVTLTSSYSTGNSWSTAAMTPNITVNTGGVYSVIHIDGNGCASASSSPVVVNVFSNPSPPSITAGGSTTICQGSFVTLTSSYTSGNTWSTGGVTQNINVTTSGTYTVTHTNVNGCSSTSSPIVITVIPVSSIPTVSASGSTTICDGSSVTLTSSDPNSTWSTGATTQAIVVTTSGSYSVVGNQTGCPSQPSAPVVVNVNPSPATPVITPSGPTTICEGEELFLFTSGTGTNTWSTGYIGQVLEVTVSGNYWVSVENVYGCTASSTVVPVTVNANPVVTINPMGSMCTFTAPFTMSNGLPAGGTYSGDGITGNIFYPAAAGVGSSIVTYTYVDVNDCSSSAQTTLEVNNCAGIDEEEKSYFSLFPNPNNGQFKVTSSGTPMEHIIIYDAQGKMVFNESYSGIFTLDFDLNAYSNGVYYIEINSDQEIRERIPLIINH